MKKGLYVWIVVMAAVALVVIGCSQKSKSSYANAPTNSSKAAQKVVQPLNVELVGTLSGHSMAVKAVAFSPDGKLLASGSNDWNVRLWDPAAMNSVATLEGHESTVSSLAFSLDGTLLASGDWSDTIRIWDVSTLKCISILKGSSGHVRDGRFMSDWVVSLSFSPDGKLIAGGLNSGNVQIWDVAAGKNVQTLGKTDTVSNIPVAFSPDGKLLATGGDGDPEVKLWDVSTWKVMETLKDVADIWSLAFSPDGKLLVSGNADGATIWDMASRKSIGSLKSPQGFGSAAPVQSLSFTKDGKLLAGGTLLAGGIIWDIEAQTSVAFLNEPHISPDHVAFSPDAKFLVTDGGSKEVCLWKIKKVPTP